MQRGNFRSLMASSSWILSSWISAEWEWRAQSQTATTPSSPLPRGQRDPAAAPQPHLTHRGRKFFHVELSSVWIPRDAPGLALIPARYGAMGHSTWANRGSSEQTATWVTEATSQSKNFWLQHPEHTDTSLTQEHVSACQQQAPKHCSRLPFNPHPLQNLVLLNPSEPGLHALSDATMNKLHSHKVIKQLTAVKTFLWHTTISYFFLHPTAMSHLRSTLRLLMKYPYLIDIKLCAQTAHKIFYFSFFF